MKGRMGELVRALDDVIEDAPDSSTSFFACRARTTCATASRSTRHGAFESVVAGEVRAPERQPLRAHV